MNALPYPVPVNEEQRLDTLSQFNLMDTPPEDEFDRLAQLAARLFKVPIVLVSLLGRDRQFFKARIGFDPCGTSREISFCAHAIMQDEIMVVNDALKDWRFNHNPLVTGAPFIRFYAGKALRTSSGDAIGTVCLIDTLPRETFDREDRRNLADLAALVMDRIEMRRLDVAKAISQQRFENIAATSPDAIICTNAREEVTFWNRAAERLFGYTAIEMMAKDRPHTIIPASWRPIYEAELEHLRAGERMELADKTVELSGLRKDGTEFPAEFSLSTWREDDVDTVGAIVRDLTERKQNEERLYRLASIDPLTGLANRAAWQDCLRQTLSAGLPCAVLLFDLDRFKEVNDTLGHSAGDVVLRETAQRLQRCCQPAIMVGRLGGDEFVALIAGDDQKRAHDVARLAIDEIIRPIVAFGETAEIGVSIGIAMSPGHGGKPEELLTSADLALYRAKAAGKGRFVTFDPAFREAALSRRSFQQELRRAFDQAEFELFYQPEVSISTGQLTGAEALLRWNHPSRGLLSPASFIEVLSEKPSAPEVGAWILRAACRTAARWRERWPSFRIGVNLFAAQFRAGSLDRVVQKALSDTGLPASALELEIVETILLGSEDDTVMVLDNLRRMGVGLAFDDYGTGYASLSLLKKFPVTRLKIDRSFIRDVTFDTEDAAVVNAIIYLAKNFGMEVIAEGVETEEQRQFLSRHAGLEGQGYLFGKPMPAKEFESTFGLA